MQIKVLFLGPARDFAQTDSLDVELPEACQVGQLRDELVRRFPTMRNSVPAIRLAVNRSFANDEHVLQAGDEVALIPPVSGG